ncbi:hypothetical protein MRX96_052222 [Rhipicephalus microplus]
MLSRKELQTCSSRLGSFLVMYATVMSLLAVPLLHMEAILGQFTHAGNRGMLECAPRVRRKHLCSRFAGLSYTVAYFYVASTVSSALTMSHAVLYLLGSIQDPLPWATCRGLNTTTCYVLEAGGVR